MASTHSEMNLHNVERNAPRAGTSGGLSSCLDSIYCCKDGGGGSSDEERPRRDRTNVYGTSRMTGTPNEIFRMTARQSNETPALNASALGVVEQQRDQRSGRAMFGSENYRSNPSGAATEQRIQSTSLSDRFPDRNAFGRGNPSEITERLQGKKTDASDRSSNKSQASSLKEAGTFGEVFHDLIDPRDPTVDSLKKLEVVLTFDPDSIATSIQFGRPQEYERITNPQDLLRLTSEDAAGVCGVTSSLLRDIGAGTKIGKEHNGLDDLLTAMQQQKNSLVEINIGHEHVFIVEKRGNEAIVYQAPEKGVALYQSYFAKYTLSDWLEQSEEKWKMGLSDFTTKMHSAFGPEGSSSRHTAQQELFTVSDRYPVTLKSKSNQVRGQIYEIKSKRAIRQAMSEKLAENKPKWETWQKP